MVSASQEFGELCSAELNYVEKKLSLAYSPFPVTCVCVCVCVLGAIVDGSRSS